MRPSALDRLGHGGVDAVLPGHVHLDGDRGFADLGRRGAGAVDVYVADRNPRAFAHVGLGEGPADPARRAGDKRSLSLQPFHAMRSPSLSNRCSWSGSGLSQTLSP